MSPATLEQDHITASKFTKETLDLVYKGLLQRNISEFTAAVNRLLLETREEERHFFMGILEDADSELTLGEQILDIEKELELDNF